MGFWPLYKLCLLSRILVIRQDFPFPKKFLLLRLSVVLMIPVLHFQMRLIIVVIPYDAGFKSSIHKKFRRHPGIFWTCYVRSVVVLYQGGHIYSNFGDLDNLPLLPSSKCLHLRLFLVFFGFIFYFCFELYTRALQCKFFSIHQVGLHEKICVMSYALNWLFLL